MHLKTLLNLTGDTLYGLPLVVLYLTDGCNSRCAMCDIWRAPRRNMPLALAESIAQTAGELGMRWVLFSGGEAMQHPAWPTIAGMFRAQGVRTLLLTNGLLVAKQRRQVIEQVDELIVSLDAGTAATYEAIRGVDALELVLRGIREVRAAGLPVTTRTTIMRQNYAEMPQIIDAALAADATTVSFLAVDVGNPFAFGARDALPDSALAAEDIDALAAIVEDIRWRYAAAYADGRMAESPAKLRRILVDYFRSLIGVGAMTPPRCNAPHVSTVVDVDGTLRPCYFLPAYGRLVAGGDRLSQAINSDAARDLRRAYRQGQRAECARCVCPLHKSARDVLRM